MTATPKWRQAVIRKGRTIAYHVFQQEPPEGCPMTRWRNIFRLVTHLCAYLPNPEPTQATLAKSARVSERTIRNWMYHAQAVGAIEVKVIPSYHAHLDHNSYTLRCLEPGWKPCSGPPSG